MQTRNVADPGGTTEIYSLKLVYFSQSNLNLTISIMNHKSIGIHLPFHFLFIKKGNFSLTLNILDSGYCG